MKTFQPLGILPEIEDILKKKGIIEPTEIQKKAIPPAFKGVDLIAKAQTGTGKTLAFLLPLLQRIHKEQHQEQALIIAPTRELVKQIAEEAKWIGEAMGIDVLPIIGGRTIEGQLQQLGRRPQVIIGTPGRLLDHLQRGSLRLETVRRLVLDEVDQMLHMGFIHEIEMLLDATNSNRQLLFYSATIPDRIRKLAKAYMKKPTSVTVEGETVTLDTIEQKVIMIPGEKKLDKLISLLKEDNPYLAIVFCNKKEEATWLSYELTSQGFSIGELQGDMSQGRRLQVLKEFMKGRIQILVATDIVARGIDIEGISHIYNWGLPSDVDYYIHRIGRTGRAGRTGVAVSLVTPEEESRLRRIERAIQSTIVKYTVDGQVKQKGAPIAPKKKKVVAKPTIHSTYQSTKKKAHKATGHKGANTRKRRVTSSKRGR